MPIILILQKVRICLKFKFSLDYTVSLNPT